jgi:hypothetical protein
VGLRRAPGRCDGGLDTNPLRSAETRQKRSPGASSAWLFIGTPEIRATEKLATMKKIWANNFAQTLQTVEFWDTTFNAHGKQDMRDDYQ